MAVVESETGRDAGSADVCLPVTCDFTVSPTRARENVIAFLARHAGPAIYAGEPTRVHIAQGRMFWLAPIFVALPHHDPVGPVHWVPVDADTGELEFDAEDLAALREKTASIVFRLDPRLQADWEEIQQRRAPRASERT